MQTEETKRNQTEYPQPTLTLEQISEAVKALQAVNVGGTFIERKPFVSDKIGLRTICWEMKFPKTRKYIRLTLEPAKRTGIFYYIDIINTTLVPRSDIADGSIFELWLTPGKGLEMPTLEYKGKWRINPLLPSEIPVLVSWFESLVKDLPRRIREAQGRP